MGLIALHLHNKFLSTKPTTAINLKNLSTSHQEVSALLGFKPYISLFLLTKI
jgi:hypothetical protein